MKFLTIAGLIALASVSCTKRNSDGNLMVLHLSQREDVKSWDPATAYDPVSLEVIPMVHETLYQYAYLADTYKVVPLLAADLPRESKDRLTITIPIRRGIKWQDDGCFKDTQGKGRELKAQDFVFGLKRLALPSLQSQGWWLLDGKIEGINAFHEKLGKTPRGDLPKAFLEPVSGIKAIDDYTLQIKLVKPYPQLMYALSMSFTAPMAQEAVAAYGDENQAVIDHAVGTGPFVLVGWDRGKLITLERNPTFHPDFYPIEGSMEFRKKGLLAEAGKPLPFLDRVAVHIIKERQAAWQSFLKGTQDLMLIPTENFSQAIVDKTNLSPELASKGIRLSIEPSATFWYVSFNMQDRLLGGNKYLRQALASAIDREKWIARFTNGTGRKANTVLPPGIPDRAESAKLKYDFDLARAKELLTRAGFPEGRGLPIFNFDLRGSDSLNRQLGEFFTEQFAAIGVKVNVIHNTFPAFLEKMKRGNLQISHGGWNMDYPDPENAYQLLYGLNRAPGPNESNFDHEEMNKLHLQMASMSAGPKRAEVIAKMDEIVQEESPWALGYYQVNYTVSQAWLLNYREAELIRNRQKYLRVNRDVKSRYREGGKL